MAVVYILYSRLRDKYYVGSCEDHLVRIEQHLSDYFPKAFTLSAKDWIIYFVIKNLGYLQSRKIEKHIKRMKSKKYIENLKQYTEMQERLIKMYE